MQYLTIVTWKILFVTIGVILIVAFSTYFERKVIGSMQGRVGPNRVGPLGLGQPFADVIKLLIKEVIVTVAVEQVPVCHRSVADTDSRAGNMGRHSAQ